MSDLRDLYQEMILDHQKRPRNFNRLENANRSADGYNPLCGDKLSVYAHVENGVVSALSFHGSGCAISTASASMMTECLTGKTEAEVDALFEKFHALITGEKAAGDDDRSDLGKLEVFAGVCEYPSRVKCATLAWHTLQAALKQKAAPVTTESGGA